MEETKISKKDKKMVGLILSGFFLTMVMGTAAGTMTNSLVEKFALEHYFLANVIGFLLNGLGVLIFFYIMQKATCSCCKKNNKE